MSQQAATDIAKEVVVRKSRTTILDLNEDCWIEVMKCLNVKDQLRLASSNLYIGEIFQRYASLRYKRINGLMTTDIDDEDLKQLLHIVGEHLVLYVSDSNCRVRGDQQLGLLRSHCPNLEHLGMTFRRMRKENLDDNLEDDRWISLWDNLCSLTNLKSLSAQLVMCSEWCSEFVSNLKQLTCLRKLKLEVQGYRGRELYALDQLESLEVNCSGFDAESLMSWKTMKQLRELKFGYMKNISINTVEILVKTCQQLERLAFMKNCIDSRAHELFCQLPRLKHLQFSAYSLSDSFIQGMINKQGSPLESFIPEGFEMEGLTLSQVQVKHLCDISSLKELCVSCDTVPLKDLLKLKNLQYLHIRSTITTDQILILLKGLPHLKFLNVLCWDEIDSANLVSNVRTWVSEQSEKRAKIKIVLSYTEFLSSILYSDPMVEIEMDFCFDPILINEELGERDQN